MDEVDSGSGSRSEGDGQLGRRDVIKRGAVGVGVAGAVWAAPAIAGLSLRPDFAAAASGTCTGKFATSENIAAGNPNSDVQSDLVTAACGVKVHTLVHWGIPALVFDSGHPADVTITVTKTGGPAGCVFTDANQTGFTGLGGNYPRPTTITPNSVTVNVSGDPNLGHDISINGGGTITFGLNCT